MILSFADRETEKIWNGIVSRRLPTDIQRNARKKLYHIHSAVSLSDLAVPPGNRLHELKEDRAGQHAISINDAWRICFTWRDGNAYDVEIVNYH